MADVNIKLYQQMVDKGIVNKFQKKDHDGKIDTDDETNKFNASVEENFDANGDNVVDEKDKEEMIKTYNQMADYLATINLNAANMKVVNITPDEAKGITSQTKMFFNEAGELKQYQDNYEYYEDGKIKGYTQHNLTNGTVKVVKNFEYIDGIVSKWDEEIFTDATTSTQHKQEITWADDHVNAETRTVQDVNKTTGEVEQIRAYQLEDNTTKKPLEKTTTLKKTVSNSELNTIKTDFLDSINGVSDNFKDSTQQFEYKINFGDLTQSAKVSEFKRNDLEYKVLSDSDNNAVAAVSNNNDTSRVYKLTTDSNEEFLSKLDDFSKNLNDNINIFANSYSFSEYKKEGENISLKAALADGESKDALMNTWALGTNYSDIADDFQYNENNKLTSFKILNKTYNVLYNDEGEQVAVVADNADTNSVYQLKEDTKNENIKDTIENSGYDLKDNVKVYNTGSSIENTEYETEGSKLKSEGEVEVPVINIDVPDLDEITIKDVPNLEVPDLEEPEIAFETVDIEKFDIPEKPVIPADSEIKTAATPEESAKCLAIAQTMTISSKNLNFYNVKKDVDGNIIAFDIETDNRDFVTKLQESNKSNPTEDSSTTQIKIYDIKYNGEKVSTYSSNQTTLTNKGEKSVSSLSVHDLENKRTYTFTDNQVTITEQDDLNRTSASYCIYESDSYKYTYKTSYTYVGDTDKTLQTVNITEQISSGVKTVSKSITTDNRDAKTNKITKSETISAKFKDEELDSKSKSINNYTYNEKTGKLTGYEYISNTYKDGEISEKYKTETTYKYDEKTNKETEYEYTTNTYKNGILISKSKTISEYEYDKNGYAIGENYISLSQTLKDGEYISSNSQRKNTYSYENGILKTENSNSDYQGKSSTTYTYDENGMVLEEKTIAEKDKYNKTTKYTYFEDGTIKQKIENKYNYTVTTDYNSKGQVTKKTYNSDVDEYYNYTTTYTYEEDGITLKQKVEKNSDYTLTTDYNSKGNVTKETYSSDTYEYYDYTKTYVYEEDGITLKQKVETRSDYTLTTDYNSKGNVTKETSTSTGTSDYNNYTKTYVYEEDGITLKQKVETRSDYTLTTDYNSKGKVTKETSTGTSSYYNYTITYTYWDDNKTLKQKVDDQNSYTTTYDYNSDAKITQKIYVDKTNETYNYTINYEYNANGNILKEEKTGNNAYTDTYTYYEDGKTLKQKVETHSKYTRTYDYNTESKITKETSTGTSSYDNYTTTYTYWDDNKTLKQKVDDQNNYTRTSEYNSDGKITKETYVNKTNETYNYTINYEYNANGNILKEEKTGNNAYTDTYTYYEDGKTLKEKQEIHSNYNQLSKYNSSGKETYIRKTSETYDSYNFTKTFEYDNKGNLTLEEISYDKESYFDENYKKEYIYDAAGNLIRQNNYSYSDMLIEKLAQHQYNIDHDIDVTNSQAKINEILASGHVKINGTVVSSIDEIKNAYTNLINYLNDNKEAIEFVISQTNLSSSIEEFLSILKKYLKDNTDKVNLGTTPDNYYQELVYGMRDFYGYGNPGRTESLTNIMNNTMFPANLRQAAANILAIDKTLKENPVIANLLEYDSYSNENSVLTFNRTMSKLELNAIENNIKALESKESLTNDEKAILKALKKEYIEKEAEYKALYEKNIQALMETADIPGPLTKDKSNWKLNDVTPTYLEVKNKTEITTTPAITGVKELTSAVFVKDTTITPSLTVEQITALYNSDTVSNSELGDDFFVSVWRELTPEQRKEIVTVEGDEITVNLAGIINYDIATPRTYKIADLEQITGINLNYTNGTNNESTIKQLCSDNILMKAIEMAIIDNHGPKVFNSEFYYGDVYTYMTTIRTIEKRGNVADWNKGIAFIEDDIITYTIKDYDYPTVSYYNPSTPDNVITKNISELKKETIRVIQTLSKGELNDGSYEYKNRYSPEQYDKKGRYDMRYFNWTSPLSFDKNANGIKTTSEVVDFDIDGDGKLDKINNSEDLVLAFDADGDGIIGEDGKELFGNNTDLDGDGKADGYENGFDALKTLALKHGLISENDSVLDANDLKYLQDKVGLRLKNGYLGEAYTFDELGITQINLPTTSETQIQNNFDGQDNDLMTQENATFIMNGEERTYADIWHKKK